MSRTSFFINQFMSMRQIVLILVLMMAGSMSAQDVEAVDSLDEETGIIYHPDGTQEVNSLQLGKLSGLKQSVPQIPLGECDSLLISSFEDRYGVIWKDGKCGVYDLLKEVNVTRIEYSALHFSFRKEYDGEFYTYFAWDEKDRYGVVSISEETNVFVTISFSRKDNEEEQ